MNGAPQGAGAQPPLVRFLSKCNVASRAQARDLVRAGRVTINGRVVKDGSRRVDPVRDRVTLDGVAVSLDDAARDVTWWMVNKPRGAVSTTSDPEGRPTVMDLVPRPHPAGLAPVGRLDKASAGLLLLANDNALAARLLDPRTHVEKVYRVKVRGHPDATTLHGWRTEHVHEEGLDLGPMRVDVERVGPRSTWLVIGLSEGRNRQIRRRMEAAGHEVEVLIRLAFGPLALEDLAPGAARRLTAGELAALRAAVS